MKARAEKAEKLRLESLSDLIFGLALSIGSLVLIARIPQTPNELVVDIIQFGFSFLILVVLWNIYNNLVDILPANNVAYLLNFALLFLVSIEPFLYYVFVLGTSYEEFATSMYAVDVGLMYFVVAGMTSLALNGLNKSGVRDEALLIGLKNRRIIQFIGGTIFIASSFPFFWVPAAPFGYLRLDLWLLAFFTFSVTRIVRMWRNENKSSF